MSPSPILTLSLSQKIINGCLEKGRELGCAPLTVSVLDAGGHLLALVREDGAAHYRTRVAIGKAAGAIGLGTSSRKIAEMAAERPQFVAALSSLTGGQMVPAAGGVRIRSDQGIVIGAVGISGDSSDRDEACALYGLQQAQLTGAD